MLLVAAGGGDISLLVNVQPQRFTHSDSIQNFAKANSQAIISKTKLQSASLLTQLWFEHIKIKSVDDTDGLRITLTTNRVIHLRPSGYAPELRCYAEAETYTLARQYVVLTLNKIKML